jgi:hypothetical protein
VWRSPEYDPDGPYEYTGYVADQNGNVPGYMSDPDVLIVDNVRYTVWATGVPSNCGTFKTAQMTTNSVIDSSTIKELVIQGVNVLGSCDPDGTGPLPPVARPYVEGASLFKFDDPTMPGPYTLVFPAKPNSTPRECQTSNGGPGNANSVIAYATSSNVQGPYNYQGIIMCGATDEWTNQATITKVNGPGTHDPYVIAYHDSPGDKVRKIHADCLFANNGRIAGVYRQPQDAQYGFNDCVSSSSVGWEYSGISVADGNITPGDPTEPNMLHAANAGNDPVKVARYAVGAWERFNLIRVDAAQNIYVIKALVNGKYLCTTSTTTALKASCTSETSAGARFKLEGDINKAFALKSVDLNKYLNVRFGDRQLYADSAKNPGANYHEAVFVEYSLF